MPRRTWRKTGQVGLAAHLRAGQRRSHDDVAKPSWCRKGGPHQLGIELSSAHSGGRQQRGECGLVFDDVGAESTRSCAEESFIAWSHSLYQSVVVDDFERIGALVKDWLKASVMVFVGMSYNCCVQRSTLGQAPRFPTHEAAHVRPRTCIDDDVIVAVSVRHADNTAVALPHVEEDHL